MVDDCYLGVLQSLIEPVLHVPVFHFVFAVLFQLGTPDFVVLLPVYAISPTATWLDAPLVLAIGGPCARSIAKYASTSGDLTSYTPSANLPAKPRYRVAAVNFRILGRISHVATIARGSGIRELPRLRRVYGAGNWRKPKGIAQIQLDNGDIRLAELHWYEAHGKGRRAINRNSYLDRS